MIEIRFYVSEGNVVNDTQMSFDLSKLSKNNFKAHDNVRKIYDDTSCIPYILNIACAYM